MRPSTNIKSGDLEEVWKRHNKKCINHLAFLENSSLDQATLKLQTEAGQNDLCKGIIYDLNMYDKSGVYSYSKEARFPPPSWNANISTFKSFNFSIVIVQPL